MSPVDVVARNNVVVAGPAGAPVVVLAHGFGCDQNLWRLVVPRLVSDNRADLARVTIPTLVVQTAEDATTSVDLAKGDTLLLYTDGLTEARVDTARNRLGEEALLDFASAHAPTTAEKLVTDLETLLSTLTADDDVAALSVST